MCMKNTGLYKYRRCFSFIDGSSGDSWYKPQIDFLKPSHETPGKYERESKSHLKQTDNQKNPDLTPKAFQEKL